GEGFNFLSEQLEELLFISANETGMQPDPVDSHKSVSRFTLRQVLLAGLEDIVHFGRSFMHYEEAPDGKITVFFEDGTSASCDVLVGADGSNSRVRRQFLPHAQRIDTGYRAIQGKTILTDEIKQILPSTLFKGPASIIAPKGYGLFVAVQQFQHKPGEIEEIGEAIKLHPDLLLSDTADFVGWGFIARQEKYHLKEDMEAMDGVALKQVALRMIDHWHPHLQKLIRDAEPATIIFTSIYTSLPVEHWQTRRITLIGDAIHSMTPARGIGANTALRDASLLGRQLIATSRGEIPLIQGIHDYEIEMLRYGFAAVLSSKKALEQGAALDSSFNLALAKTAFRFLNAVPSLKQRVFRGFGDN
ncbi:MAG TPA: FAD-dependent monooxygenase, partial [Ktedonobacteraceae bacterium]|nr:FAD-dependent monooxygenase [Ktedonobacteraceae bacterium]